LGGEASNRSKSLGQTKMAAELEAYVIQAIIDGFVSPETQEAVVAYRGRSEKSNPAASLQRVWRYSQGELVAGDHQTLRSALGDDRSKWPALTFVVTIEIIKPEQATLSIETFYDRGLSETSRGGHAQKWKLEKQAGAWSVVEKQITRFWD
jgi:hypothetical protein